MEPKLTIELVPAGCWWANLRYALPTKEWDKLRKWCYRLAGYKCQICGGKGKKHPVECHEMWKYDDGKRLQTLVGIIALCPSCHRVKHAGHAMTHDLGADVIKQLMKVNGWSKEEAEGCIEAAFNEWERRNDGPPWDRDLSWLETIDYSLTKPSVKGVDYPVGYEPG